jgi:hypothetical protein
VHDLHSEEDAAIWAISALGLRFEPNWGSAREALRAASALDITNLSQVSAALGATNSPANDLRTLRNFVAHRNRGTALELRRLWNLRSLSQPMRADNLLGAVDAAGKKLFDMWVDSLRLISLAATT